MPEPVARALADSRIRPDELSAVVLAGGDPDRVAAAVATLDAAIRDAEGRRA